MSVNIIYCPNEDFSKMFFDKELNSKQIKIMNTIVNAVEKEFKSGQINSTESFGLNPIKVLEDLEKEKEGLDKKKQKFIDHKKKGKTDFSDVNLIVIFKSDGILSEFLCRKGFMKFAHGVANAMTNANAWIGLLDYPIPMPLVFGRIAAKIKHGGGVKTFATFPIAKLNADEFMNDFFNNFEINYKNLELETQLKTKIFFDKIESDFIVNEMKKIVDNEQEGSNDFLNYMSANKQLLKLMKGITHFGESKTKHMGTTTVYKTRHDVSVICIPLEKRTLIYLINYDSNISASVKILSLLCSVLNDYQSSN